MGAAAGRLVEAFRRVTAAVHAGAPGSALMWAPSQGGGHPFTGGAHGASAPGDVAALDTDGDGVVSATDDPYAPYWPGEDAADWVGMSLYHWGDAHPWGENEVPGPGEFLAQLTGTYTGLGGNDRGLPDFYAEYGERYDLPVAVPETAAFFAPGADGADELAVKQTWWQQLFDPQLAERLPRLAMVNWFEWAVDEPEVGGLVDRRATGSARVRDAFRADLPGWALDAGDVPRCDDRADRGAQRPAGAQHPADDEGAAQPDAGGEPHHRVVHAPAVAVHAAQEPEPGHHRAGEGPETSWPRSRSRLSGCGCGSAVAAPTAEASPPSSPHVGRAAPAGGRAVTGDHIGVPHP